VENRFPDIGSDNPSEGVAIGNDGPENGVEADQVEVSEEELAERDGWECEWFVMVSKNLVPFLL
jgi:hypothetical protein